MIMEQIIDFLGFGFFNAMVRFFICIIINWIIVDKLYFRKSKRRDFYFTFMLVTLAIYFLVSIMMNMKSYKTTMGIGLGLFGIFSIMRYRTDSMPIREMTYLFVIVCLSVIHAMGDIEDATINSLGGYARLLIIDCIFIITIVIFEKKLNVKSTTLIQYDRPELAKPKRREELIADLEERTGLTILNVEVGGIDYLRDAVVLRITYEGQWTSDLDKQFTVSKSQLKNSTT